MTPNPLRELIYLKIRNAKVNRFARKQTGSRELG